MANATASAAPAKMPLVIVTPFDFITKFGNGPLKRIPTNLMHSRSLSASWFGSAWTCALLRMRRINGQHLVISIHVQSHSMSQAKRAGNQNEPVARLRSSRQPLQGDDPPWPRRQLLAQARPARQLLQPDDPPRLGRPQQLPLEAALLQQLPLQGDAPPPRQRQQPLSPSSRLSRLAICVGFGHRSSLLFRFCLREGHSRKTVRLRFGGG